MAEDRRFYLVDATGRLIDELVVGSLVQVGAWTNPDGSILRLTMPDGAVIEDDVRTAEPIVSQLYGRTVHGHVVDGPGRPPSQPSPDATSDSSAPTGPAGRARSTRRRS